MSEKSKVVIIGAGKIGRGYIADLFNEGNYPLVFLDYSKELVNALNKQGYYTINKHHRDATYSKVIIKNYEAFCTQDETDKCIESIANATYISINIFPGAVDSISKLIAEAIRMRIANGNYSPLNCIIGVNFLFSSKLFRTGITSYLKTDEELKYLDENVALIESLVHRNGAFPTEEMLKEDPLSCNSGDTPYMSVDNIFKGPMPENVGLKPVDNVPQWMIHKIWVANMAHSLSGYMGKAKGYTYIGECRDDAEIMKCVTLARREGVYAMYADQGLSYEIMEEHDPIENQKKSYLDHAANSVDKDTIDRVCGDLTRKLAKQDRLIGPALACLKHGKIPFFLSRGVAYAYRFNNPNDKTSVEIQNFIKENGIRAAITKYSDLSDDNLCEKQLKELILGAYHELDKNAYPFDLDY